MLDNGNSGTIGNYSLTSSGQYCSYHGFSEKINEPEETRWFTEKQPTPYGNYQEANLSEDVCGAWAAPKEPVEWGSQIDSFVTPCEEKSPNKRCGMEDYASLAGQGLKDRPWAPYFGSPELKFYSYTEPQTFEAENIEKAGAWGYMCPVVEDSTTGNILEICFEDGVVKPTAPNGNTSTSRNVGPLRRALPIMWIKLSCPFDEYEPYALKVNGNYEGTKAVVGGGISRPGLEELVGLDNRSFKAKEKESSDPGERAGEPALGSGCGRNSSLNPAEWALIGVSNGVEEWEALDTRAILQPMIVSTRFEPHPLELTTESPSEVTEHEAKIYFTVDPYGFATKYRIEYGNYSIGEYSKEGPIEYKGVSPTKIGVPLTGLAAHTPYYYRIKISYENPEVGEPVYGEEKIFSTEPTQCAGVSIAGMGATIQGVAQDKIWNPDFNTSTNATACDGEQGAKGKPVVEYRQATEEERGSGNCLKGFGVGSTTTQFGTYTFCGTDEPPSTSEIHEIETFGSGAEKESVETIPVLQAPMTIIVHLPKGCTASAEYTEGESQKKLGRLVLDDRTLEKIYRGGIKTWKELIETEAKSGEEGRRSGDKLSCTGGEAEEKKEIRRIVRKDRSGTTHIFKDFLAEVNKLNEKNEERKKTEEKWVEKPNVERTWAEAASGSENTEWPEAAKVVRPAESGGPALIAKVTSEESSIGYANLADVFENGSFDKSGVGGEGENKFWVELQRVLKSPETVISYADPAVKKDTETRGNGNCASTIYINGLEGQKLYPPISTRESWSGTVAKLNQTHYPLCGLSYDLALREYKPYLPGNIAEEEGLRKTETTENYLLFVVNPYAGGGGKLMESNNEYERIEGGLAKEIETGIKEIGYNRH